MPKTSKINKKKLFGIGIPVIVVLAILVMGILVYTNTHTKTNYFYSGDLGVIQVKTTIREGIAKFFNIFQQAVTFAKTQAEVGDTISFTDSYTVTGLSGSECAIGQMSVRIFGPSTTTISFTVSPPAKALDTISKTSSFTPNTQGVYGATTSYYEAECDVITGDCITTQTCSEEFTSESTNTVDVSDSQPVECDDNHWTNWETDDEHTTSSGIIQKRDYIIYDEDEDCQEYVDTTEYQTVCNNGYVIEGSDSNIGSGIQTCVLESSESNETCSTNADCNTPQQCHPLSNICKDVECDTDITIICDNNSTIITKTCNNNFTIDTNNLCPEDQTNETDSNQTTTMELSCWKLKPTTQTALDTLCEKKTITLNTGEKCEDRSGYYTTETKCENSAGSEDESGVNWLLWGIILGSIGLIAVLIVVVVRFRKNKSRGRR